MPDGAFWQQLAWAAAVLAAIVGAIKLLSELRLGRQQRESALRWERARAAKELVDEMLDDPLVQAALKMIDYETYEVAGAGSEVIDRQAYVACLMPGSSDARAPRVRQAFDELFYYMAVLEHYLSSGLVLFEDIRFPLDYYVKLMQSDRPVYDAYLRRYELARAASFLRKMDAALPAGRPGVRPEIGGRAGDTVP